MQLITVPATSSIKFSEKSINDVILLKKELASVTPIHEALVGCQSKLLLAVRSLCSFDKVQTAQDLIDETISSDAIWVDKPVDLRHQRCYAVKSGFNGLLDVARQTYKEATEDLHILYQEISRDHNLPSLEIKFDAQRGYFFRIPTADTEDTPLPPDFVNIIKKKKFTECTTLDLMKRNARVGDAMTEVLLMSDRAVQELIDSIRTEMSALYKVCEGVAMLDMIGAFASLTRTYGYCRPEFKDALAIKDGRHPIREKIHKERLIPNDVYASQQARFQILTGCNMSGKSTYIRQIALMAIMAQVGSFVPASYAAFPITTHLFARVSMDDNIKANVSTFAAEMRETAFILKNATEGSMVIMDELGRGTCTRDGLAIAIAICEALIQKRALVWFATHFRELGAVLSGKPGVISLHMRVDIREEQNITSMLYKIADGPTMEKHYGINLARIIGLPSTIIDRASEVSSVIAANAEQRKVSSKGYIKLQRQKLILQLVEHLQQARSSQMTDQALRRWLAKLQDDFVDKMTELKEREDDDDDDGDEDDETSESMTITTTDDTSGKTRSESYALTDMETSREGTPILIPSQEDENTTEGNYSAWSGFTRSTGFRHSDGSRNLTSDTAEKQNNPFGVNDSSMTLDELEDIEELSDIEGQI
ncbi:hypothetical protein ABW19_dt0207615 [Dactylella cylindrospora]|nr:hypothetical protein ABW19_dt0207615 [Dactylella cylindrospora]